MESSKHTLTGFLIRLPSTRTSTLIYACVVDANAIRTLTIASDCILVSVRLSVVSPTIVVTVMSVLVDWCIFRLVWVTDNNSDNKRVADRLLKVRLVAVGVCNSISTNTLTLTVALAANSTRIISGIRCLVVVDDLMIVPIPTLRSVRCRVAVLDAWSSEMRELCTIDTLP